MKGARQIKAKRQQFNLTQADVAAVLNIAPCTYNTKENGRREFTVDEVKKLSEIFECSMDEIYKLIRGE